MIADRAVKVASFSLAASGLLFLAGAIIHPHAPAARDMAEVAYTQTGAVAWWPAHLLLLSSYLLFAGFVVSVRHIGGLPAPARRVLALALPVAWLCAGAMLVHLLLPLGRDSVANSHKGWALWAKDVAETADAVWALGLAAVAWTLGRARVVGNKITAMLGLTGGLGFAAFSMFVPLTGVLVPMQVTRSLLTAVPAFAILISVSAVGAGLVGLSRLDRARPRVSPNPM